MRYRQYQYQIVDPEDHRTEYLVQGKLKLMKRIGIGCGMDALLPAPSRKSVTVQIFGGNSYSSEQ